MSESIDITVATSNEGQPAGTLHARLWHHGGRDHAEVRYDAVRGSFELSGEEAFVFLAMVARDAAKMLVPRPDRRVPGPRRQAGF